MLCVRIGTFSDHQRHPVGTCALRPRYAAHLPSATPAPPCWNAPLPERVMKYRVTKDGVHFNDEDRLAVRALHRHARRQSPIEAVLSFSQTIRAATWMPIVGPALSLFPRPVEGRLFFLAIATDHRAMASLRGRGRDRFDDDDPRRSIKSWALLWRAWETEPYYDDRLRPPYGGCRAHRLSRTDPVGWSPIRIRRDRSRLSVDAGRQDARGKMVDPRYTFGTSILKAYLPSKTRTRRGTWILA